MIKTVICELCQSATVLDPESATELLELYQELQMQHQKSKVVKDEPRRQPIPQTYTYEQTQMAVTNQSMANQSFRQRELCPDHPEEEVTYYCF